MTANLGEDDSWQDEAAVTAVGEHPRLVWLKQAGGHLPDVRDQYVPGSEDEVEEMADYVKPEMG